MAGLKLRQPFHPRTYKVFLEFFQNDFSDTPAVFSSCMHISWTNFDKRFGENLLLWLRDMISEVAGVQAILE